MVHNILEKCVIDLKDRNVTKRKKKGNYGMNNCHCYYSQQKHNPWPFWVEKIKFLKSFFFF